MQRQTYGYLPSRKASPSLGWYKIILLGDKIQMGVKNRQLLEQDIFAQKYMYEKLKKNKMPKFYIIFARKINKFLECYTIFAPNARILHDNRPNNIFFRNLGGICPHALLSPTPMVWRTCPELLLDSDPNGSWTHKHLIESLKLWRPNHYATKPPISVGLNKIQYAKHWGSVLRKLQRNHKSTMWW